MTDKQLIAALVKALSMYEQATHALQNRGYAVTAIAAWTQLNHASNRARAALALAEGKEQP